jgi:CheY-like chemotaxis protein
MQVGEREVNVLVVEDVPDVAVTFAALIRAYGHRTQVAYDGDSASRMAREFRPHTVFIDIGLPDMDGYDLARRLRGIEGLENSRLVSISGKDIDPGRFEESGLNVHLKKPVTMDALLSVLNSEAVVSR